MYQDETWHGGMPRTRPHCVRRRSSSPPLKSTVPQFSAHVYHGQMAECIRIPLDTEIGLCPGDIVLDGTQLSPKRGTAPSLNPNFRPVSIVAKRSPISAASAELLLVILRPYQLAMSLPLSGRVVIAAARTENARLKKTFLLWSVYNII